MECRVLATEAQNAAAEALMATLRGSLRSSRVTVRRFEAMPEPWDHVVVVLLLGPAAVDDSALAARFRNLHRRIALVPVVDGSIDDFTDLDGDWANLGTLQMVPLGQTEALANAVRIALGLSPHPLRRRLFVSYHSDSSEHTARLVEQWLETVNFHVFRDKTGLSAGQDWYEELMQQIRSMDYLLLISTPELQNSDFVQEEVTTAQASRIPIRVISVGNGWIPQNIRRSVPVFPTRRRDWWVPFRRSMRARVRSFVNAGLGLRDAFEARVKRMIRRLVTDYGIDRRWEFGEPRTCVLEGQGKRLLLVWNPTAPSIELMYDTQNVRGHDVFETPPRTLVCTPEYDTPRRYRRAAQWVAEPHDMVVCSLAELEGVLRREFAL